MKENLGRKRTKEQASDGGVCSSSIRGGVRTFSSSLVAMPFHCSAPVGRSSFLFIATSSSTTRLFRVYAVCFPGIQDTGLRCVKPDLPLLTSALQRPMEQQRQPEGNVLKAGIRAVGGVQGAAATQIS